MTEKKGTGALVFDAYVDGGCRGNPGPAGCAAVLVSDGQVILKAGQFLGDSTNNRAEYAGLLLALKKAAEFDNCRGLRVFTDSQLMARQITGVYKVRDAELQKLRALALEKIAAFDSFEIHDIPRSKNVLADKLVNKSIDAGTNKK